MRTAGVPATAKKARTRSSQIAPALLAALLLLAFLLRLFRLDSQSLWWDEGISLHLATSALADIFSDRLDNIHPPLYFVALKLWVNMTSVTPFSARYLSVLASWLQVPLLFAVARRWSSGRAAAVAGILITFSAVSVIYAQEIRVYAMLPLIYLALLALTRELTHHRNGGGHSRRRPWLALGLVTWIGLHLHYITLFVVAYSNLWALLVFLRARRWRALRWWVAIQLGVLAASLPWLLALVTNWQTVQGEATAGTFAAESVPLGFLLSQVWTFFLTGLAGALSRDSLRWLAAGTAVLLLLAVVLRLARRPTRAPTALLLAHWLVPLASALLVWLVRSFSHPRYVVMFLPGLIMLLAGVWFPGARGTANGLGKLARLAGLGAALGFLASSVWGLGLYFFDPTVAKDNVRAVARLLEQMTSEKDLILVPDTDWSLFFEYAGAATVAMPRLEGPSANWEHLAALTRDIERVFVMDYGSRTRDWQAALPFALEKAGYLSEVQQVDGLFARRYVLEEAAAAPVMNPAESRSDPLWLTGAYVEPRTSPSGRLAVALRWQVLEQPDLPVNASLRLLDVGGSVLAQEDARLVDALGRPADEWHPGMEVTTYHVMSVPEALPPLAFDVALRLYMQGEDGVRQLDFLDEQGAPRGQETLVGHTNLVLAPEDLAPAEEGVFEPRWPKGVELAPGLQLVGARIPVSEWSPGQEVAVELLWQATAANLPDYRPELILVQEGAELASAGGVPAWGRYPTTAWHTGERVREWRRLSIPAGISGKAELLLRVGNSQVHLGDLALGETAHAFKPPAIDALADVQFGNFARLAGYELSQLTIRAGEPLPLTLLWQSRDVSTPTDYVVFTHLLDADGRLIAQHDGVPAQGRRPTTTWIAGEFILDEHELVYREPAYTGPAQIEVGLYDPATGQRVRQANGSDRYVLPLQLTIR